jgi:hypothetical protein
MVETGSSSSATWGTESTPERVVSMAFKVVPASTEVTLEAHELLRHLPGRRSALAHATLLHFLDGLGSLEPGRHEKGIVSDIRYEQVPGREFFRARVADRLFGVREVCVFFVALLPPSVAPPPNYSGVIRVLGFCWWEERNEKRQLDRAGARLR